jgi:hypothetical protein
MERLDNNHSQRIRNFVNNYINNRALQDPMDFEGIPPLHAMPVLRLLPSLNIFVEDSGRERIRQEPNDTIIFVQSRDYCTFWFYRINDEIFQIIDMGPDDMTVTSMGNVEN